MQNMAEVIIDTNGQCKRRLPTWMQSNDAAKNEKCGKLGKTYSPSRKQKEAVDTVSMIESLSRETDVALVEKKKDAEDKDNFTKKNGRKPKQRVGSKGPTRNFVRSKRKLEEDIIGMTEDEAELDVEDLISFAEELLNADKAMQDKQSVTKEAKSSKSCSIPTSSSAALEENLAGVGSFQLSKCNQPCSSHVSSLEQEQTCKSASFSSSKIIQSGDAAQDMLELFLGPLLKNAPPKKSELEVARELRASTYDFGNQDRSFADVGEWEPLTKKKSSLKDKVALFF